MRCEGPVKSRAARCAAEHERIMSRRARATTVVAPSVRAGWPRLRRQRVDGAPDDRRARATTSSRKCSADGRLISAEQLLANYFGRRARRCARRIGKSDKGGRRRSPNASLDGRSRRSSRRRRASGRRRRSRRRSAAKRLAALEEIKAKRAANRAAQQAAPPAAAPSAPTVDAATVSSSSTTRPHHRVGVDDLSAKVLREKVEASRLAASALAAEERSKPSSRRSSASTRRRRWQRNGSRMRREIERAGQAATAACGSICGKEVGEGGLATSPPSPTHR